MTIHNGPCGLRFFYSVENGGGSYYSCDRPEGHQGRHRQKIYNADPPAYFSWPDPNGDVAMTSEDEDYTSRPKDEII